MAVLKTSLTLRNHLGYVADVRKYHNVASYVQKHKTTCTAVITSLLVHAKPLGAPASVKRVYCANYGPNKTWQKWNNPRAGVKNNAFFTSDFNSWLRHLWKSCGNHHTRDRKYRYSRQPRYYSLCIYCNYLTDTHEKVEWELAICKLCLNHFCNRWY